VLFHIPLIGLNNYSTFALQKVPNSPSLPTQTYRWCTLYFRGKITDRSNKPTWFLFLNRFVLTYGVFPHSQDGWRRQPRRVTISVLL